ncbi:hypothetical protein A2671_00110 [Candidatus Kaiserbacteria bacterium RIFCSPHIGHO2_01_FULL_49_13]|uniref:Uncharacterized protein n=1 Tax=Candidatus Kaiserbacteria bacterium RIFCSPHIGHO2_01_FULL_49_13 TaxID=1798477 RepID=A0A1F6CE84_9BACT|nr:MAG: hypothetical protein A2671_00110 [Candidatus Kaiserbacteria bacterium RIFCSPHIGHO2_01_FULL_49_13]
MQKLWHPTSGSLLVGETLLPGTVLQETDLYPSPNGRWESCPTPGDKVEEKSMTIWVRPATGWIKKKAS